MTNILLVGCGKMGGAMLRGWQANFESHSPLASPQRRLGSHLVGHENKENGMPACAGMTLEKEAPREEENLQIVIVSPSPRAESATTRWVDAPEKIDPAFSPDVIVLAVKPQQMAATLPCFAPYATSLFLSIAAGQSTAYLAGLLGNTNAAIVRAMPNLPAQIGHGITGAVANEHVSLTQKQLADRLLQTTGGVVWIEDESLIDAVTALSGSGPAYVFALCEAMGAAGEKLGLPAELAQTLARQTMIGSGALMAQDQRSATELREAVTSKGGTTAAALDHLLGEDGLHQLMDRTLHAALRRAKELGR